MTNEEIAHWLSLTMKPKRENAIAQALDDAEKRGFEKFRKMAIGLILKMMNEGEVSPEGAFNLGTLTGEISNLKMEDE